MDKYWHTFVPIFELMRALRLARLVCLREWLKVPQEGGDRWTEMWQDEERIERKGMIMRVLEEMIAELSLYPSRVCPLPATST